MNLAATIELFGGGPGSGCNPEKGKCGRPAGYGTGSKLHMKQSIKEIHENIRLGARQQKAVFLKYQVGGDDENPEVRTYLVEPYSYRKDKFFGYDVDGKGIKAFSLLKIRSVSVSDKTFKPRWKVELAAVSYPVQMVHLDAVPTFHPPSLKKPRRVPVDQPGETDDRFLDVTKRRSKQLEKERHRRALTLPRGTELRIDRTTSVGLPLWSY